VTTEGKTERLRVQLLIGIAVLLALIVAFYVGRSTASPAPAQTDNAAACEQLHQQYITDSSVAASGGMTDSAVAARGEAQRTMANAASLGCTWVGNP
jgi:hypothetical protein